AGNGDPLGLRLLAFLADPQGEVPAQALRLGLRALATTAKGSPVPLPLVAVALRNSDPALAKRLLAADPLHDAGYFELKAHTEQEARAQLLYLIGAETLYRAVGDQENARRVGLKRGQKALLLADEDLDWVSQALERDPFPQTVPAIGPATAAASEEDLDPARLNEAFDRLGSLLLAEQSISPLAGATWLLLEDSIFEKGRRS